jgi:hypothetical protein
MADVKVSVGFYYLAENHNRNSDKYTNMFWTYGIVIGCFFENFHIASVDNFIFLSAMFKPPMPVFIRNFTTCP